MIPVVDGTPLNGDEGSPWRVGGSETARKRERERDGLHTVPHPALSCTGLHSRVSSGLRMLGTPSHEHAAPCIGIAGWTGNQSPPTVYSSPAHPSYPYRARRRHTHPPPPNVGTSIPPYYGHGAGRYERCATPHAHALGHPYPHPLSPLPFPLPSPSQASQASQTRSQSLERVPAVPLEPSPASGPQWSASLKVHRSFFPSRPVLLTQLPYSPISSPSSSISPSPTSPTANVPGRRRARDNLTRHDLNHRARPTIHGCSSNCTSVHASATTPSRPSLLHRDPPKAGVEGPIGRLPAISPP